MELIFPSAVSVIAISLYVVALGNHRTTSTLADASNLAMALIMIGMGLASAVGLPLSGDLLANPDSFLLAVGRLIQQV